MGIKEEDSPPYPIVPRKHPGRALNILQSKNGYMLDCTILLRTEYLKGHSLVAYIIDKRLILTSQGKGNYNLNRKQSPYANYTAASHLHYSA